MCGIAGIYSTSLTEKEILAFKKLLVVNQLRGDDSTGVIRVSKDLKLDTLKAMGDSSKFVRHEKTKEFMSTKTEPILFVGHCRAATKGSVSHNNAHPFVFQNVSGVMNGTFNGSFKNSDMFETDTEAIYFNINKSIADNDGDFVPGLQDSFTYDANFALTFINRKTNTLNFIRGGNGQMRPLHFTYLSGRTTLIWSSTSEMLEFIVNDIMGIKASGWKVSDEDPVWTLNKYDLYQIQLGKPASAGKLFHTNLEDVSYTYVSGNSYTNPQSQYYYGLGYDDYVDGDNEPTGKSSKSLIKCSDGQYRSREAERKRLAGTFPNSPGRVPNTGNHSGVFGSSGRNKKGGSGNDLSTLSWLQSSVKEEEGKTERSATEEERFEAIAMAKTNSKSDMNRPQSTHELKYRLKEGCMSCGNEVNPDDLEEVARVRWWSREAYACGDCYEFSDGDWVRCSIEDDWTEQGRKKITAVKAAPVGVSVH